MQHEISRHFVTIDGRWGPRQVHYRRAGQGPAVLLLHQSPQSSREMTDLMRRWATHFTAIAPDTPAYGQSDPLGPAALSMDELAAAALEFADAIGLRRFGVYGFHTGASIGVWLAARHPERVTAVAANGLAQLTPDERREILRHYLPPVVPSWDGSHLAWLWGRVREQTVFFPWHERSRESRMDFDMPSPERLQSALLEFMRAGDHYAIAYRAAFESRPEQVLPGLRVPLLVTAAAGDPLQAHLGRLRDLPALVETASSANTTEALERCLHQLLTHQGDPAPAPVATRPIDGRLWSRMIRTGDGQARVLLSLSGNAEPVLVIHDAGGSAETMRRIAEPVAGTRPVVIPDLPGHGEADPPALASGPPVRECAASVFGVLNDLGLSRAALVGQGAGSIVALEIARRAPFNHPRLGLIDVPLLPEERRASFRQSGLPPVPVEWHGGHLLQGWHLLRDGRLFFPWFERTRAGTLRVEPDLDPLRLHLELRELMTAEGSWQNLFRDALAYPLHAALQSVADSTLLAAAPASGWNGSTRDAAALVPGLRFVELAPTPARWLVSLLESPA